MIRNLALFILAGAFAIDCSAQGTPESTAKDKLESLWKQATKAIGGTSEPSSRKVAPGAKPEILLSKGRLYFGGKELVFGGPIADWRATIGKGGSCSPPGETPGWCKWDQLGLEILGTVEKPRAVVQFRLYFAQDKDTEGEGLPAGGGEGDGNRVPWLAYGVFPGYFALEGTGIDAKTPFRDIKRISPSYRLKCGLMSCRHPGGAYGANLKLFFLLSGDDERDVVREITLSVE